MDEAEMLSTLPTPDGKRLTQVDALRGIAAMAVVMFHVTTRYNDLFHPITKASWAVPHGHHGVNLFFIISGFVIFLTLERTRQPMDFVVSRFSRLFPAYWCAIALTFALTHLLALPIKTVTAAQALANTVMVHGYLGIPHVDDVYWTLEVELMFYLGMFFMFRSGRMLRLVEALLFVLALRVLYVLLDRFANIELPWTLSRVLILTHAPWFCIGIGVYKLATAMGARKQSNIGRWWLLLVAALATLAVADSPRIALLAAVLAAIVYAAAVGRLPMLNHPLLVWLGAISYPLYLLHENIGWAMLRKLIGAGTPIDVATVTVVAAMLALATVLHKVVELPAMLALRRAYRARKEA